ncbi:MAG: peptidase MA family metallohydrolase [Candidatus Scalindua sp.]
MLVRKKTIHILPCLFAILLSTHCCFANELNRLQEIRSNINKGISLYKEGRNKEALPYLEDIINSEIVHPDAYYVLGEIYYARNELQKAIENWEIAQSQSPHDAIRSKITKAKKELKLDEKLSDKISCNFVLKYDQDDAYSSELVLHSLVNAYNELAYDFGLYENSEFTVILYSNEDFTNILNVPSWAAAIYDGKIRIPFQYATLNIDELEAIIRHELTHAILHRIAGNNVPAWLHEGIAQYKDGVDDTTVKETLRQAVVSNLLIPISELNPGFVNFKDSTKVKIAYAESLGFIEYLIDNYGFYTILDILNNFNNYSSLDELITSVYNLDLNQLENGWLAQLKLEYHYLN